MLKNKLFSRAGEEQFPLIVGAIGLTEHKQRYRPEGLMAVQLTFCYSGKGLFRFYDGPGEYEFSANQWMLLPKLVPHDYVSICEPAEIWRLGYITLEGERLDELFRHFRLPYYQIRELPFPGKVWEMIRQLWTMADHREPSVQWEAGKFVYTLIAELLGQHAQTMQAGERTSAQGRAGWAVGEAQKIMNEHYGEPLLMSAVAETVGFTHQHLNRIFKKQTGETLYRYLQHVRLRKSELLLQNGSLSINEIAMQVGMDPGNYIRLFSRLYGTTPAKYRERTGVLKPARQRSPQMNARR